MKLRRIEVTIRGICPLFQRQYHEDESLPEGDSRRALYRLPDGTIYQPAWIIEMAIERAADKFKLPGRMRKTYRDLVKRAVLLYPEAIPHKIQEFVIDRRTVVGRVMRGRPKLDQWELDFTIEIRDEQLPVKVVKQILDYAGSKVGIGDYRPRFGRFTVTKFKEET